MKARQGAELKSDAREAVRMAPLHTVRELMAWTPSLRPADQHCRAHTALAQASCALLILTTWMHSSLTEPATLLQTAQGQEPSCQLLVCHDLAGGYHEDSFAEVQLPECMHV